MERKSVISKISGEVLKPASSTSMVDAEEVSAGPPLPRLPRRQAGMRRKRKKCKDPDLPEFQPSSRGKAYSFKEVMERKEREK